jgi:hypothetical protein
MYTLDVFEYELDESMALYGTIPIMLAHNKQVCEQWIDSCIKITWTSSYLFMSVCILVPLCMSTSVAHSGGLLVQSQ